MTRMKQKEEKKLMLYLNFSMTRILNDRHTYWYLSTLGYVYLRNILVCFHVGVF